MDKLIFDQLNQRYWIYGFNKNSRLGFLNDVKYCVKNLQKAQELYNKLNYDIKGVFDTEYALDITETQINI